MSDDEFRAALEAATLPLSAFDHRAHVRDAVHIHALQDAQFIDDVEHLQPRPLIGRKPYRLVQPLHRRRAAVDGHQNSPVHGITLLFQLVSNLSLDTHLRP